MLAAHWASLPDGAYSSSFRQSKAFRCLRGVLILQGARGCQVKLLYSAGAVDLQPLLPPCPPHPLLQRKGLKRGNSETRKSVAYRRRALFILVVRVGGAARRGAQTSRRGSPAALAAGLSGAVAPGPTLEPADTTLPERPGCCPKRWTAPWQRRPPACPWRPCPCSAASFCRYCRG